jgi:predicted O-linked N-acetylglucosamine transferase (SPINDLY family)
MRLLSNVDDSLLWLYEGHPAAVKNLRIEAEKRGVSPERLVFAERMPLPEHLARYRFADLFLDTFYYNAGATAADALRVGVPVVTCLGETFAARMAASLLNAVGLSELVTSDRREYEAVATRLATDGQRLASLRQRLAADVATQPLFDTRLFAGHLEQAYGRMYGRLRAGLAPDHIVVDS